MNKSEYNFPLFKKRFDGKAFYKVLSTKNFIEVQKIGERSIIFKHEVKIYPDQLLLKQLLHDTSLYLNSDEEEFNAQKKASIL